MSWPEKQKNFLFGNIASFIAVLGGSFIFITGL